MYDNGGDVDVGVGVGVIHGLVHEPV